MGNRRNQTSDFIRDAALSELVRAGHSALTMESIARASYSSIGSVYARYAGRSALFADLLASRVAPALERLSEGSGSLESRLSAALADDGIGAVIRALTELALAARHDVEIRGDARRLVGGLVDMLAENEDEGIRWLVAAVVLGRQFLVGVGCTVPPIAADLARFVRTMSERIDEPHHAGALSPPPDPPIPDSPEPKTRDAVAESLSRSTARMLAEKGITGANLKEIAADSGVTTGAVYRRYGSKNELVRDTVVRELSPRRYEWTERFVAAFAGTIDDSPGDILADQVLTLLSDRDHALSTLEMMHAARVDTAVREVLTNQFHAAAAARTAMFAQFADAGAVSETVNPLLMGWLIQTAPAGGRILVSLDMTIPEESLRRGLRSVVSALAP
ncbi:MAG: Bacterial regulatory protein tetR family [Actinomycetota bacterium]